MHRKRNKGGRPTKDSKLRRRYSIQLRLSEEEFKHLQLAVIRTGVPRCDYIRKLITKGRVKPRVTPELQKTIRQLCGMANNLNQIARKANVAGYNSTRNEYLSLADKIDNLINEIEK